MRRWSRTAPGSRSTSTARAIRPCTGSPDDAWGLDLWAEPPPDEEIEQSLELYDEFYAELGAGSTTLAARGPFVVLDLHSYNHRRDGADAPPAPAAENPEVNVGTGSLDRDALERASSTASSQTLAVARSFGHQLDVRENVRFRGGELSRWVNERYADRGCALAIEFKKMFMDEWTGDRRRAPPRGAAPSALAAVVPALDRRAAVLRRRS